MAVVTISCITTSHPPGIYSSRQRHPPKHHTHFIVPVLQHHLDLFIRIPFSSPAHVLYINIRHSNSDYTMSQRPFCTQLGHLPLAKFSHTTTSLKHKGPFNWSHIPGEGTMIGIFEKVSTSSSTATRLLLKIAHNNHVLVCLYPRNSPPETQLIVICICIRKKSIWHISLEKQ